MPSRLLLASTSPYRRRLLERLRLPFAVEPSGMDETTVAGEAAAACAVRLARAKAQAVGHRHPEAWILGSDQVAECGGRMLGKPGDAAGCRAQLQFQSGRLTVFHTAAVLWRAEPPMLHEHVDRTTVSFRTLSPQEIVRYVEADAPYDCAGSFRAEGQGIALFESIESRDPTALVGLPLIWVAAALRKAGFDPFSG